MIRFAARYSSRPPPEPLSPTAVSTMFSSAKPSPRVPACPSESKRASPDLQRNGAKRLRVPAAAQVPEGMDPVDAAPLMCAGVTVFNGLRRNTEKAHPPALVAVVG